jgi:integrase
MPRLVSLNVSKPGTYNADPNLYLIVRKGAKGPTRSWVFRFQLGSKSSGNAKVTDVGLGPSHTVSLKEAREKARAYRQLLLDGINPLQHRNEQLAKRAAEASAGKTFDEVAAEFMREHASRWVERHHSHWVGTLRDYVSPVIGNMRVADVDTAAVLRVLKPIWHERTITASNVRGRIERVLAFAAIHGYARIDRQNPAAWSGHLKEALPAPRQVRKVKPMPSLPFGEMPDLIRRLGEIEDSMAAIALMFAAHTAVRSHDIRHAKRADIDREAMVWSIPVFSKSGKEHRVPLTEAALALIDKAIALADLTGAGASGLLFANPLTASELSENAGSKLLAKLGLGGQATMHGFRSAFRTWAAEVAGAEHVVAEQVLGHSIGGAVYLAYQRGDLLRRRASLMERWSAFLTGAEATAEVVPIKRKKR